MAGFGLANVAAKLDKDFKVLIERLTSIEAILLRIAENLENK